MSAEMWLSCALVSGGAAAEFRLIASRSSGRSLSNTLTNSLPLRGTTVPYPLEPWCGPLPAVHVMRVDPSRLRGARRIACSLGTWSCMCADCAQQFDGAAEGAAQP
jgi:hypothetical protein